MSEPQGSLIYLMRFLEGHLSASEDVVARERLEAPDWQDAWQRLQLAAVETTLPVTTWEEPTVPAETLAAFLEGNLSVNKAARIEQDCWASPELLRELISTYRFLHVAAPREEAIANPSQRTDHLLALFPDAGRTSRVGNMRSPPRPETPIVVDPRSADASGADTTEGPVADLPVVVNAAKRSRRQRRRTPVWIVYAATIVIGLGLGLGAVVMITLSRDTSVKDIVSPSQGEDLVVPTNGLDAPDVGPRQPGKLAPNSPGLQFQSRPIDIVNDDPLLPDGSDPMPRPPQRPSPTAVANDPPNQQYQPLEVVWDNLQGLVVARENDNQPWHGTNADVHRNTAPSYATFPDSWASAKTDQGRIVLASDTQVRLDRSHDSIHMNVARGKVAISEMPAKQRVQLKVGPKSWIIKPIEEDTAFGVTVFARQSQLVVRRGKVAIDGTEIGIGQVTLGNKLGTPIRASTGWFTRPEKVIKIPAATRKALLASRDIRADLAAIWRTDDHPARLLAARWSLAIATEQTLANALSARDDKLRFAALDWLLSSSPDDPRVHLALRTLARQTDDPLMFRNVLRWLKSARAKDRVTRDDANRMVQGLNSDHLAIRQICVFFLENAFGKHVVFDPKGGPAARQKAVREWTMLLNRTDRAAIRAIK